MKNINRKAISFILAIAMMISLIPTNVFVFAADETTADTTTYGTVTATIKPNDSGLVRVYESPSLDSAYVDIDTADVTLPETVTLVDYYSESEILGNLSNSVYLYQVESEAWPTDQPTWVYVTYLDAFTYTGTAEDEALIGKEIHVVGSTDALGDLVASWYYDPMSELHLTESVSYYNWTETDAACVFTITDVYNTAWGVWYQVTTADEDMAYFDELWVSASEVEFADESGSTEDGEWIEDQLTITQNGKSVSEITLPQHDKISISATPDDVIGDDASYQWQILIDENKDRWADIYDYVNETAAISYALIGNMLNENGIAKIRCTATDGENRYVSNDLAVIVAYNASAKTGNSTMIEDDAETDRVALDDVDDSTLSSFEIQIRYVFADHQDAAAPVVAAVAYGQHFQYTATSPAIVGYTPYIYDSTVNTWVEATTVKIDIESVTEEAVYLVVYRPQIVTYTIRHYIQNVNDDEYTEYTSTVGKGYTGEWVPELNEEHSVEGTTGSCEIEIEGFTALHYESLPIAGNGSTVINVYYDRNYYLVDFDLDGGYGINPISVRYGAMVSAGKPTKPGYGFSRWELTTVGGNTATDAEKSTYNIDNLATITMPAKDLLYTAVWTTETTTYTVVYWWQNADPNTDETYGYSVWYAETKTGVTTGTTLNAASLTNLVDAANWDTVSGHSRSIYFTYNEAATKEAFGTEVTVNGDGSTVVNIYFDRNDYTLRFYYAMSSTRNNSTTHYIVGGSTNYFGRDTAGGTGTVNASRTDEIARLQYYFTNSTAHNQLGEVDALPQLQSGKSYTTGTETSKNGNTTYTYYYLTFNAKYGANISELWPCDVFEPITTSSNKTAFASAWNGEYYVQHSGESNQTIKGKYQILDDQLLWDYNLSDGYTADSEGVVSYLCFWENGADNITWSVPELYRYKIWLPCLENVTYPDTITYHNTSITAKLTYDGINYYLADIYDTCDDSDQTQQTQPALEGFEPALGGSAGKGYTYYGDILDASHTPSTYYNKHGANDAEIAEIKTLKNYTEAFIMNFFYTRNSNNLLFNNQYDQATEISVPYGTDLSAYANYYQQNASALYPSSFEEGSHQFAGWFMDSGCTTKVYFSQDEYDAAVSAGSAEENYTILDTMPDKAIMLYAKWVISWHTVKVYLDNTKQTQLGSTQTIEFGSLAQAVATPTNGEKIFAGWFYFDPTTAAETSFVFSYMPIKQDLEIYAKWHSTVAVPYTVHYTATIGDKTVEIAEPSTGSALADSSKSFTAKTGNALYEEYREGYFPQEITQVLTLDASIGATNEITFHYVYSEAEYYIVRYVDADTGKTVYESAPIETKQAAVTETFTYGLEYMQENDPDAYAELLHLTPDAYQKTLLIHAGSSTATGVGNNIITFYWSHNEDQSVYRIVHYVQSADNDKLYSVYSENQSFGMVGNDYSASVLTLDGFAFNANSLASGLTYDANTNKVTGTLKSIADGGLSIELYYDRQSYPYSIQYVDYSTKEAIEIANVVGTVSSEAKYGTRVSADYVDLTDHGYEGLNTDTQSIVINSNESLNVMTFYYTQEQVDIYYKVYGDVGGSLTLSAEYTSAVDGPVTGSTAQASAGYKFIGWYVADENGVLSAEAIESDEAFVPAPNDEGRYESATYYAVFEAQFTSLTIKHSMDANVLLDSEQAFIFEVSGTPTDTGIASFTFNVAIIGNDAEVTIRELPVGQYTVTVKNDWSWRYTTTPSVGVKLDDPANGSIVELKTTAANAQWLSDNSVQ